MELPGGSQSKIILDSRASHVVMNFKSDKMLRGPISILTPQPLIDRESKRIRIASYPSHCRLHRLRRKFFARNSMKLGGKVSKLFVHKSETEN